MSSVMGDPKTVLEGSVKYRDKKKWKSRWAVVSKLSPVADCLHIQLYRDSKERCKNGPTKASLSLEDFMGMETGFTLDKESNTMALICPELVVVLAFDNRELLIQWQVKIRANLVEEQQFLVQIAHVPPKSKLPCGPARLHLQDHSFCLVSGVPPRLLGTWPLKELRRFGVVDGKFCFEGGSLCGRGEGLHVLLTNQSEELSQSMDLASKGKLMGKRKTLSRKASVLETSSSRYPVHKRCHMDSKGSSVGGDCRPLLSSGSEASTCDACSEILRPSDNCCDDSIYSGSVSSVKAASCRIHYRWPSCLSRWGQSSTTTTSDVDSVDTVSVILSDCQGSSHSATMSKSSIHGQSLSCLCDTQGTWPFNQCTNCGRQYYGRNSFQSCKGKVSPEPTANEETNGFSPQWTMDSVVGSSIYGQSKKDSVYQLMNPPSDRASLCSHASHSSSASAASSSGSEYSAPKNFFEALYDKPKNMQHAVNGHSNGTTLESRRTNGLNESTSRIPTENCGLCPCHEPMKEWMSATAPNAQEKHTGHKNCACWNKLAMSVRSDLDSCVMNGRKSASANASPNSSPKKTKYNTGSNTMRPTTSNDILDPIIPCTCGRSDPYANYAIPKPGPPVIAAASTTSAAEKVLKPRMPLDPSEEYDVPKKFAELLPNCDTTQKVPGIKSVNNGSSCSCMSACKIVHNMEFFKMASKHSYAHKHGASSSTAMDALQMCACQRVMLWAGSIVPCLGPQTQALDTGWQYNGSFPVDRRNCQMNCYNPPAVCTAPPKSTEVVMKNGKVKHLVRDSTVDTCMDLSQPQSGQFLQRPRSNTVSYSLSREQDCQSFNYANIELQSNSSEKLLKVSDDSTSTNYANIEFADTLSLYENSSLVLSRLENDESKLEQVSPNKPPLPPRSHLAKKVPDTEDSKDKCKCQHSNIRKSPKKSHLNQVNGSAYEMMCYQKETSQEQCGEDYLMMQPLYTKENTSPLKVNPNKTSEVDTEIQESVESDQPESKLEPRSALPLRPFMPYSYPISENTSSMSLEENAIEFASRKNQLINEDFLRSMRSNSLSELKKKVLMRKRSSSVDGKNNGYHGKDSGIESVPASPVSSPKPSLQRKNSLFSKLSLRSKEKSMSTNEIALPPLPISNGTSSILMNCNKNGLHRSADCLKLSEEYANSDDDLNSDNSDFVNQKEVVPSTAMKRSSSVPCRAALPSVTTASPIRNNSIIEELNDLNKDSGTAHNPGEVTECQEMSQRKYSLDSHERSKRVLNSVGSDCDNMYRQESLDECDTVMEMQGVLRRNHAHSDRNTTMDNYRSATSSCSSSDISDYMESLSFISRSSSSSSGSTGSADYMRSEDLYNHVRTVPRPPPKSNLLSINNGIPNVHQSHRLSGEINGVDISSQSSNHRSNFIDDSSSGTSSSCSYQNPKCHLIVNDRPGTSSRGNRDSRSSTSSTSSLSTSPSVTDYSSSTSSSPPRQNQLPVKHAESKVLDSKPIDSKKSDHLCASFSAGAKKST